MPETGHMPGLPETSFAPIIPVSTSSASTRNSSAHGIQRPPGSMHGGSPGSLAPSNVYRCADGDYMIGANGDAIFARLCTAMGQPELATSERYATHAARGVNQIELDALIEDWTSTLSIDEVEALMIEHSIPAGRIFRGPDMLADPHFAAREAIVAVPHPVHGEVRMQNCFPKLSDTPSSVHRTASRSPGEHNAEVYGERLSLSQAALDELAARGIV